MFSILKRRSTWYFIVTTVIYISLLSVSNNGEIIQNMTVLAGPPLHLMLSFILTLLYLFALLWCLGAKWKEDKYIKRNPK